MKTNALSFAAVLCGLAAVSHAVPTSFHDAVSDASPILWYQFNESEGNTINHGSLGASHDAAHFGPTQRDQPTLMGDSGVGVGPGVFLESLGSSMLTGNPTFSCEAVIFIPSGASASLWPPLLHWGDGAPNPRTGEEVYFSLQANNADRLYAGFYNAGVRTVGAIELGSWHHVVWTREGGNDSATGSVYYVDGAPVGTEIDANLNPAFVTAEEISIQSTPFRVNAGRDLNRFFTGVIDELALYDRILTPAEIADRAARALGSCPGDCDQSNDVSFADLVCMLFEFGTSNPVADCDESGLVGFSDLVCALFLFGPCP